MNETDFVKVDLKDLSIAKIMPENTPGRLLCRTWPPEDTYEPEGHLVKPDAHKEPKVGVAWVIDKSDDAADFEIGDTVVMPPHCAEGAGTKLPHLDKDQRVFFTNAREVAMRYRATPEQKNAEQEVQNQADQG